MKRPTKSKNPVKGARRGVSDRAERDRRPKTLTFKIVYEDDDIVIVDKPSGMLSATPPGSTEDSLFSMLRRRYPKRPRNDGWPVYIIHRLDREASGLLCFARSARGFGWLKEDFRARRVQRSYVAVAEGQILSESGPATGTLQSFLKENRYGAVQSVLAPEPDLGTSRNDDEESGGIKLAVTHYEVLRTGVSRSLVRLRMETGRKHQIRVQMADFGHPLVGDTRYGAKSDPLRRLGLHAVELALRHPATGRMLRFVSEPPPSFFAAVGGERFALVKGPITKASDAVATKTPGRIDTSWDPVAPWYDELVDERRHDHYDDIVAPGALRLVGDFDGRRILDVACGQGDLCRRMAALGADVVGLDASPKLIETARRHAAPRVVYTVGDARDLKSAGLVPETFDAVTFVMALMNVDPLEPVLKGCAEMLKPDGRLVVIMLHPAFRAPRQSSWGTAEKGRELKQFRRIDGYLSAGQFEITMNPGATADGKKRIVTWTFHRPLQTYFKAFATAGLAVESLEEWPSLRSSQRGTRAAEENRVRREIPLFIGIVCRKLAPSPARRTGDGGAP